MKTIQKIIFRPCFFCLLVIGCTEEKTLRRIRFHSSRWNYFSGWKLRSFLKQFDLWRKVRILSANTNSSLCRSALTFLKKRRSEAQITALTGRKPNILLISSSPKYSLNANLEANRIKQSGQTNAAPQKQLDMQCSRSLMMRSTACSEKSNLDISDSRISQRCYNRWKCRSRS